MYNTSSNRNAAVRDLQAFINSTVGMLVDHTDQIEIDFVDRGADNYSAFIISVAKEDMGRVIGTQGRTIAALRTIIICASTKLRLRTQLEVSNERKDRIAA